MQTQMTTKQGMSVSSVLAVAIVTLAAALLVVKNLMIDNAVVFHDEYVYRAWSDITLSGERILQLGLATPIPNRLYAWVYGIAFHAGSNAYDVAQALNVGFWGLGTLAVLALARRAGVSGARFACLALALALLPWSTYTKYFMPEAMYAGVYLVSVLALMEATSRRSLWLLLAAGLLNGLLYYVKPHALIVFGVNVVFVLTLPRRWWSLATLFGGFALGHVLVRIGVPKLAHVPGNSLGVYKAILQDQLNHLQRYEGALGKLCTDLAYVAAGHLMMFMLLFGLPLVAALGMVFPRSHLLADGSRAHAPFARYLLLSTLALMGVAVVFTVFAGELGGIHSRYYAFLTPLWVCMIAFMGEHRFTRHGACLASVLVLLGAGLVLFWGPTYAPHLDLTLVSGSPEWGVAFASLPAKITAIVALLLATLLVAWTGKSLRLLLVALAAISLVACWVAAAEQKGVYRNGFTDGRDAIAVQQVMGKPELERTLVIGRNTDETDKFLFFLQAAPHTALLPENADLAGKVKATPDVDKVILLAPSYPVPENLHCAPLAAVRVCDIVRTAAP